jgi:F-type H+-transporting ATPase subunit b
MSSTIFWQIVAFLILWAILFRFVLKPVRGVIENREKKIRESIDKAERAREAADRLLEEHKRQLAEARADAQRIMEQSRQMAENVRKEMLARAQDESREMLERAKEEIRREKEKALMELQEKVIDLTLLTTERVIKKSLALEDHIDLVKDALSEVSLDK